MNQAGLNGKLSGVQEPVLAPRGRNALLMSTCLAAGAAAGLISGCPTPAHATPCSSNTTITSAATFTQNWCGGTFSITNSGAINVSNGVDVSVTNNVGSPTTLTNNGLMTGSIGVLIASSISALAVYNSGTIADSIAVDLNGGTLGLLNNSGVLGQGVQTAVIVNNLGSLTSLVNNAGGTIWGANNGAIDVGYQSTIGAISNAGVIKSNITGLLNQGGTIGALTNSGVIAGGSSHIGLENASACIVGVLGTLTNATGATISGGTAVYNTGSIATLANSGTLIGVTKGVENIPAGSIAGSGTIGVLTNSGNISAGITGIEAAGSIGTISNSGVIAGTSSESAGIWIPISGSVGSISNAGTISGSVYAIVQDGTVGALNNSGVITSPTALIFKFGTASIGQITNTGTIAGNIINGSGRDLSIAGGAGTVYGTLTGLNGSIGTIANSVVSYAGSISIVPEGAATLTGGDITLSGNILLNDMLQLGSHKLVNSGALQVNHAISITGGYSQSSGGLIVGVTSPTNYGQLLVSGTAALTGGLVGLQPLTPGVLAQGQSYTIVQAQTLTASGLTAQVASFNASISTITVGSFQDLVITLGAPLSNWTSVGIKAGGPANPIGVLLDQIAAGSSAQQQQFQNQILSYLSGLTLAQQEFALKQMSPNQMVALAGMANTSPALNAILQHQDVFASTRSDFEVASLSDDYYGDVYGDQGRGLWGKLVGGGALRTDTVAAYGAADYGLVFGADLYRTSSALAGVAASWLHANITGHGDLTGSTNGVDSYQITAYGAYKPAAWGGHWLVSGQAAFAYNRYNQDRRVDAFAATATTSYAGQQYLANGTVGYIFNKQGYNLTAYTGFREVHVSNPHYIENGAGLLDMQVNAIVLDSFTQETGVKYDGVTSWQYGKLFPSVKIGWAHDYTNGPIPISGSLAGVTFVDPAKRPSADGVDFGAGVNAQLKGWSIGLEYQGEIRSDFQSHTAALKANIKF